MRLGRAPQGYDPHDQDRTRAEIEASDGLNYKSGQDIYFTASKQRVFRTTANTLTAHSGGGKASALVLTAYINRVTTVAADNDSLLLMPAKAGLECVVINDGAHKAQLFGQGSDTINAVATGTGVSLPAASLTHLYCPADGLWIY